jgi:hypothetical protein
MNFNYFKFYGFVLMQDNLNISEKLIFSILFSLSTQCGFAFCSNLWLSSILGLDTSTIKRHLSHLKELGFIDSKVTITKNGSRRAITCFPNKFDNYVEFNFTDNCKLDIFTYDWLNDPDL